MSPPSTPPAGAALPRSSGPGFAGEGWYRRLVEQSPDGICVYSERAVVFVNTAGVRMMGADSSADIIGRPVTDFVTAESISSMLPHLLELRNPGDATPHLAAEMIRADGSLLAVEVMAVKLSWEGGDALQVITRDVSARAEAEAALRYQAALVNHVTDAIIGITADGVVTSWNPAAEVIYGRAAVDAVGMPVAIAVGADLRPPAIIATGGIVQAQHRSADGHSLDVRVSVAAMDDGYVLVCSDLTALRRAEQHFEAVVTSMIEGLIVTDKDGRIKSTNPAVSRILGLVEGTDLIGLDFFEVTDGHPFYDEDGVNIPPQDRPARLVLRTGSSFDNFVFGWDSADGRGWLMSSCRLLNPGRPGHSDMLITFIDITAQRADALEMKFLATHDGLTSLPNRAAVLRRIDDALQNTTTGVRLHAVLFIDVDHLKITNDTHGHQAGDDVLRITAERLRRTVETDDVVGRWGGDEFVILICRNISAADVDELVARLHSALAAPAVIATTSVPIGASIGVVEVGPSDRRTADEILRDADRAMYEAKRARR